MRKEWDEVLDEGWDEGWNAFNRRYIVADDLDLGLDKYGLKGVIPVKLLEILDNGKVRIQLPQGTICTIDKEIL